MLLVKKNKKLVTVIAHIIAWVCFFSLPYIFLPRSRSGQWFNISTNMYATFICINVFLILFYYFNTQVLIPRLFKQKKWLLYSVSIIACFLLFLNAPKPIADVIAPPENNQFSRNDQPVNGNDPRSNSRRRRPKKLTHYPGSYLGFILVFSVGLSVAVIQEWLKSEEDKKEMEHERLNTELSLLKSQINPHFFFNTLNNIYSLAIMKSDETASSILKLSSIMRYVLTETDQPLVPLANEIEFLQNFINLQSVRLTDKMKVNVDIQGDVHNWQIAPLLLIPFVENAFKYGVSTVEASEINIRLNTDERKLRFFVSNHIVPGAQKSGINTGIGIVNVKRRLALLYPERHTLKITEQNHIYTVNLEIDIA